MKKLLFKYTLRERDEYLSQNISKYEKQQLSPDIPRQYQIEELERIVVKTIEAELPKDALELFGLRVKAEVLRIDYGSMTVFFAVGMGVYTAISQYKSFFESAELIYGHFQYLVRKNMPMRYTEFYHENFSRLNSFPSRKSRIFIDGPYDFFEGELEPPRRARPCFSWLVFSLALVILVETFGIGLLVYQAVLKTYFP